MDNYPYAATNPVASCAIIRSHTLLAAKCGQYITLSQIMGTDVALQSLIGQYHRSFTPFGELAVRRLKDMSIRSTEACPVFCLRCAFKAFGLR